MMVLFMNGIPNTSIEAHFPLSYRTDVLSPLTQYLKRGESCSLVGMEDNCKINVLRFLFYRKDVQKKYFPEPGQNFLFILVDLNELMEPTLTGFYHLFGLSLIEALRNDHIQFSFLNNIFIDSPGVLMKSLKEDIGQIIEKTGGKLIIAFNEFDMAMKYYDLDLLTRNLLSIRQSSRSNLSYIFTSIKPVTLPYAFYQSIVWMKPFSGSDAIGVIDRNCLRFHVKLTEKEKAEIINFSGGHAGTMKFIIQSLSFSQSQKSPLSINQVILGSDIYLQCQRILAPLSDIEKSKLTNNQPDEYLQKAGYQINKQGKPEIFSPVIKNYFSKNQTGISPFCLDLENDELYFFGKPIMKNLTYMEKQLLLTLIKSPQKLFLRENLINSLWDNEVDRSDWAFDKLVSRLRQKLKKIKPKSDVIKVKRGVGITLE